MKHYYYYCNTTLSDHSHQVQLKLHKSCWILIFSFLIANATGSLSASEQNPITGYNYSYLTINEGLCDNSIQCIHKDYNSFMWIGTSNGLVRYDGYEFKHYSAGSASPNLFIESNYMCDIKEDLFQCLWIASDAGLTRINLNDEKLSFFDEYKGMNHEILSTPIQTIFVDDFQNIWIGKADCLAYVILNKEREIKDILVLKQEIDVKTFVKHRNDVWVGCKDQLLRYSSSSPNKFVQIPHAINIDFFSKTVNVLFSFGDYLWIGTDNGLYCFNSQNSTSVLFKHTPADTHSLSSNFITDITKNESGDIIVATRNGVNVFQHNDSFVVYTKDAVNSTLNDNFINKVFVDENNCIWVGADFGGINIMIPKRIHFTHTLQSIANERPMNISSVLEDKYGNLLVGIVDGGLAIKLKDKPYFSFYKHLEGNKTSLSENNISDIVQDPYGNYWISTIGGGINRLLKRDIKNPIFEHFTTNNSELLSNEIHDLCLDSTRNSIWMCSNNYIQSIDLKTDRINRLQYFTRNKEILEHMNTVFVDSQSRLWIGGNGIYIIDMKDYRNGYECIYYKHKLDDPNSKINEKINCIIETSDHNIYLGSMGSGIYRLDSTSTKSNYKFVNYAAKSGLSDSNISNLMEDEHGNIWISTLKGIYLFNPFTKKAIKFDEKDGLQVQQFHKRSGCRITNHQLMFGTTNGLVLFNPLNFIPQKEERKVTLTSINSNGRTMTPLLNPKNLSASVVHTKEFHLYPPDNSFEISFSCLDYASQDKVYYFYRILELNEKSNVGLAKRNARYTNLDAGKYTFEVWCTNNDNTWSAERTQLSIVIHPPFYKTNWFYWLIVMIGVFAFFCLMYWYNKRQRKIQQLLERKIEEHTTTLKKTIGELEHTQSDITDKNKQLQLQNEEINQQKDAIFAMSQQMEQLNKEKFFYFTNLAHEFKTPLTLILGPLQQMIKHKTDRDEKESLEIIHRNAGYLLTMVNQLIDLHKIDTKILTLNPVRIDLIELLGLTVLDFSGLIKSQHLSLKTHYRLQQANIVSDGEKIQKILFNLLSNAVKHTQVNGKVSLHACQIKSRTNQLLQYFSVTNTGSRIEEQDIDKIFNRFYQIADERRYTQLNQNSTGIGLHIVKELVTLLQGKIVVKSSKNDWVSFRLYFPISMPEKTTSVYFLETPLSVKQEDVITPFIPLEREKPNLLLIEDNPDMREYLKSILSEKFNVAEANNGQSGYEIARKICPDFIVSDLMMPICDGAQLCRMIRENIELCHIPFLLLTANSSEHAYVDSYEQGIDGYITKPFEESILIAQIDAILKNKDLRQQKFIEEEMNLNVLSVGQSDQQFMQSVMDVIEKHYANPNFGVQELTNQLNVSYTLIYKKFISLTGLPPVRFLLLYRLKIAKQILEKNKHKNIIVSEIAYLVGFNDPKYFTRCFVKQYNITPSSIIQGGL